MVGKGSKRELVYKYSHLSMKDMSEIKAVLWDIDGTVFSSEDIIGDTYRQGFESYRARTGRPAEMPEHAKIMDQIGRPIVEIFRNLAPDLSSEERTELSEEILAKLVENINAGRGTYYPGAIETIQEIHNRGYALYGASNGRYPYVEAILRYSGVFDLFTAIPVVDNRAIKNKTDLVKHILESGGLEPHNAILVGDRYSDRDAALENGVFFAACRFGHGTPEEWEGARIFLDEISGLLDYLPPLPSGE